MSDVGNTPDSRIKAIQKIHDKALDLLFPEGSGFRWENVNKNMNKIKVRKHRGGFKESCETMKEIDCDGKTNDEIRKAVFDYFIEDYKEFDFWLENFPEYHPDFITYSLFKIYDNRKPWDDDAWLVFNKYIGGPVGFINKRVL